MHVLYIDDSGAVANSNEKYFVLGGVSVYESAIYHLIKAADECVDSFSLGESDSIELHATDVYGGRGMPWKNEKVRSTREEFLHRVGQVLVSQPSTVRLFTVVVDKKGISPRDPVETAFEEICNRFNLFIQRDNDRNSRKNRGLIVMDESHHEKPLQALARNFRVNGARWGKFRCLAEVPLFVDSRATRLIQLADLVAWSTFRKYEYQDGRFFDPLLPKFDADGGVIHGLYHARGSDRSEKCYCPGCMSRDYRDSSLASK
jgi:hypothetical protein